MIVLPNKDFAKQELIKNRIIDSTTNCWLWQLSKTEQGYGNFWIEKQSYRVHRLAMYVYKDFNLNSKLDVLHKIECKNKHCFNPEHLYLGNDYQNQRDVVNSGTHFNKIKTHCIHGHEFTPENTMWSISLNPKRRCRICHNIYYYERYRKSIKKK